VLRADKVFFERALHPDFVYVNTHGVRFDKAGYILSRLAPTGDVRFAGQDISDLMVTSIGNIVTATMTLHDTFVKAQERRTFRVLSLCVFGVDDSFCQWIAGQTMLPEPTK
jgi:hypothetical protein